MARTFVYSRWRKWVLQGVLCLVLAAALGLASVVTQYKLHLGDVKLGGVVREGGMGVRLPMGWEVQKPMRLAVGGAVVWKAEEGDKDGLPGRVLTVVRDHQEMPRPPKEYLLTSGVMPVEYALSPGGAGSLGTPTVTMVGGVMGYEVSGVRPMRMNTGKVVLKREIFATAMLPSRDMVTVKLEGWGQEMGKDMELVREVGEGIEVAGGKVVGGDVVKLPDGCKVGKPSGYEELPEGDGHVTERHLVRSVLPGSWSGMTLVPCVFFKDGDDAETFRTMLTARDGEWLEARITTVNGVLQADLPARAGLPFPRRASLLTWPTGYALMVEMSAGSGRDAAEWDEVLKKVSGSVAVPSGRKTPVEMLKAGEEEVARLKGIGLASLLGDMAGEQWWIWKADGEAVGWNRIVVGVAKDVCQGSLESRMIRGAGRAASVRYDFETSTDFAKHQDLTVGGDMIGGKKVERFKEQTVVSGGKMSVVVAADASGQVARLSRAVPVAFVPGPWLPMVMGKMTRQEMIVRTSKLPGLEGHLATAALTVRLKPTTRPTGFEVDLSGTGQVLTMWPVGMDFSDSLVRRCGSMEAVKKAFEGEKEMLP